jgi:hypothetical protein
VRVRMIKTGLRQAESQAVRRWLLGAFTKLRKSDYLLYHVRPSAWNNSTPTERILIKFDI